MSSAYSPVDYEGKFQFVNPASIRRDRPPLERPGIAEIKPHTPSGVPAGERQVRGRTVSGNPQRWLLTYLPEPPKSKRPRYVRVFAYRVTRDGREGPWELGREDIPAKVDFPSTDQPALFGIFVEEPVRKVLERRLPPGAKVQKGTGGLRWGPDVIWNELANFYAELALETTDLFFDELAAELLAISTPGIDERSPLDVEAERLDSETWANSADQTAFRDRVLAAHLALYRKTRGSPLRDLSSDEVKTLVTVPGTHQKTFPVTAAAAGRLLKAANAALATAQRAGDADALRTIRLSANSGYRSSQTQRELWLRYFPGYYNQSRPAREKIPAGPHSDQAVAYMLKRRADGGFGLTGKIAPPGYSNHQNGIAIDFSQERLKAHPVENKSDDASRKRWRLSWFHGWLKENAHLYGFEPIPTEEWHWEYRQGGATPAAPATRSVRPVRTLTAPGTVGASVSDYLGGRLWTFTAKALPLRVAVFCPKAALSRGAVEVLVFAHGLPGGCPKPAQPAPAGFITGPPFDLGRIVAGSGRPMVLVVPSLDWTNPGGERAFGAAHQRWHALAKPANLNAVIDEVLIQLGRVQAGASPSLSDLILAGHSRAYDFLEPLAYSRSDPQMRQGALAALSRVWAFDTTYSGDVDRWIDWLKRDPRLQVAMFYRPRSRGTAVLGKKFYDKRGPRLAVTSAAEEHCQVPGTRLPALLQQLPRPTTG